MAGDQQSVSYDVNLKDGVSGPAVDAANALKSLKSSMDSDTAALREMQRAMKTLQSAATVDIETYKKLKGAIDDKQSSIVHAQGAYIKLGGTFEKAIKPARSFAAEVKKAAAELKQVAPAVQAVEPEIKSAALSMSDLSEVAKGMPGPLGRVVSMFERFSKLVGGKMIAAGIVAIAVGLVALTVSTAKAAMNLYSYAVAQGNARRSELLRLEGMGKLWTATAAYYGLAATSANELQAGLDRVSSKSALGRDKLAQYGEQLYKMGLRGKNWESALEGMSMKAVVQGDAQAQMFASWAAGLALTGGSVEKLTDKVRRQIGGIATAMLLDADVQSQKLHENFAKLFTSIKTESLLKAQAALYSMLDQGTASGHALAGILGRLVQPMVDAMTRALPIVKAFFQDMIIWELGLEIGYQRLRIAFLKAFNKGEWKKLIDECSGPAMSAIYALGAAALYFGVPALLALGDMAAAAAISMGALALEAAIAAAPFLLVGAAIWGAVEIVKQMWDLLSEDIDFGMLWEQMKTDMAAIKWGDLGISIIEAIAEAMVPGPVLDSMKSMGTAAVKSFKSLLGIASPSKVFLGLGETVPEGFAQGIDKGGPKVRQSVSGMASVPTSTAAPKVPGTGAANSGGKSGGSVTINELHVHSSSGDAKGLAQDLRRELEAVLMDLALTMGAA